MDLTSQDKLRFLAIQLQESATLEDPEPVTIDTKALEEAADEIDALKATLTLAIGAVARLLMAGDSLIDHISDFAGCYCGDETKCGWCTRVDVWKDVRGY